MATSTETKIIEIRVQSTEAIARITTLGKEIDTLDKDLKQLTATYKEGTMHEDYYTKRKTVLTAAIKAHRQEVATLSREIVNNVKQSKEKLGYIQKLEAQVSNLTLKYKQLSEAELKGSKGAEVLKNLTAKREELSTLNQAYGNHTMEVGKYGKATNQLNLQMTHLMREMPNFAISTRIGIMSLTNNLPYFIESMKAVRMELTAMKAAGEKAPSFIGSMMKSLFSFNAVVMIGITLLQLFGEDIANWIGSLFKGEEAVKKLTNAEMGLQTQTELMREALKGGGEYASAIESISKMTTSLQNAKGNTKESKKALDEYNSTLGVTFGKATDVDGALKAIEANKNDYVIAMREMAFSNVFFSKSAEDSVKVMEIKLTSNAELLGESAQSYIDKINEFTEVYKTLKKAGIPTDEAERQIKLYSDRYNTAANAERTRQIGEITKHQTASENLAKQHYKNMSDLYDKNGWDFTEAEKQKNDKTKKESQKTNKTLNELFDEYQIIQLKKIKEYEDSLLKIAQIGKKAINDSLKEETDSTDLDVEKINKSLEQRKKNQVEFLQNQLDTTIEGSNAELNAKLAILNNEKAQELAIAEQTEAQKSAIRAKYAKIELDLRVQTLQNNLSATASAFGAIQGLFKKGSKAQKAAASTQIGIDSIAGAIAAYKGVVGVPVVGQVLAPLAAAGVLVSGAKAIKDVWAVKEDGTQSIGTNAFSSTPDLTSKMASPLTNSVQTMGAMGGSNAITSGAANVGISPAFDYNAMAKIMSNMPAPELSIVELRTKERQVDFIDNISTLKS